MAPSQTKKAKGSSPGPLRYGCGILSIIGALFSLFFVIAAIGDIVSGREQDKTSVLVGLIVIFGGIAATGVFAAWKFMRSAPAQPDFDLENRILQLADAKGRRLTVGMVALHCRASIEESRAALERMALQGAANVRVEDDGGIVYDFSDLLPPSHEGSPRAGGRPVQLP
jgi:hypothetical protein